jgi:hypothetical protein
MWGWLSAAIARASIRESIAVRACQSLDRNHPIEPRIVRLVHLAHAAGRDKRDDFVGTEPFAPLKRCCLPHLLRRHIQVRNLAHRADLAEVALFWHAAGAFASPKRSESLPSIILSNDRCRVVGSRDGVVPAGGILAGVDIGSAGSDAPMPRTALAGFQVGARDPWRRITTSRHCAGCYIPEPR